MITTDILKGRGYTCRKTPAGWVVYRDESRGLLVDGFKTRQFTTPRKAWEQAVDVVRMQAKVI